jgi:hypothetical protein
VAHRADAASSARHHLVLMGESAGVVEVTGVPAVAAGR